MNIVIEVTVGANPTQTFFSLVEVGVVIGALDQEVIQSKMDLVTVKSYFVSDRKFREIKEKLG